MDVANPAGRDAIRRHHRAGRLAVAGVAAVVALLALAGAAGRAGAYATTRPHTQASAQPAAAPRHVRSPARPAGSAPPARADTPKPGALAAAPPGDDFYVPPSPLPAGAPGDVVRWRPSKAQLTGENVDAFQVMYLSTNALGKPDVVTGTVLFPKGVDRATAPLVGLAPGTQGPAFRCAASKAIESGLLLDQLTLSARLASGYAVVVTDYEGYGPTGTPTYIVGQSMGPAVLDSVRAALRLPGSGLSPATGVVIEGYSQGGGGALWAGEKQPTYAPELHLLGVAAGGTPADLVEVAKGLDGWGAFGFLAFAAVGLDVAYPDLKLDSFLNEQGRTQLAKARAGSCTLELLQDLAFKKISDVTNRDPLATPQWQARLAQNRLGAHPPKVPVLQYHGTVDEAVNFPQADALHRGYCEQGVTLQFNSYVAEHVTGDLAGSGDVQKWVADRSAGLPAPVNC